MILLPVSAGGPGGVLEMEYANALAGERHALRLHLAPFDATPLDPDHDRIYTGFGPDAPLESGVLMTFGAIGALWQQYYGSGWKLSLIDLWENQDGVMVRLDIPPVATPLVGLSADAAPGGVVLKRVFHLKSKPGGDRRLFLSQVLGGQEGARYSVGPTSGGIDGRDQALMAYLSSPDTGLRSFGGKRFAPDAVVQAMWARRLAPLPAGADGAGRDTFFGSTAPESPQDGWLWVDTSSGLGQPWPLRVYNAALSEWERVGERDQYFQPDEPASHNNGDLWVDSSSGPPYQLRVWNDATAGWEVVGPPSAPPGQPFFADTCVVFPNGATICNPSDGMVSVQVGSTGETHLLETDRHRWPSGEDIQALGGIAGSSFDLYAPLLLETGGGTALPAGHYTLGFTFTRDGSQTGLSPTATIAHGAGFAIEVGIFTPPTGVTAWTVYLTDFEPGVVIGA